MLVEQHTEHSSLCMQVVVAEGAPMYGGHQQARQLAQAGINTTAIADSAIFAMMARVNKVRTKPPALFHLHTVHLHLFSVVLVSHINASVPAVVCPMLNNGPDFDLGVSYKMPLYETVQQDSARTCCDCWRQSSWTQHL